MGNTALSGREFWLLSAAGFGSLFAGWTALAVSGAVPAQFLPTPWAVVSRIVELTQKPFVGFTLQQHLWSSVLRYLLGFPLAC
jgi:ABC-type nitrate/sulfonate/bicarbonate transport system permease component